VNNRTSLELDGVNERHRRRIDVFYNDEQPRPHFDNLLLEKEQLCFAASVLRGGGERL